MPEISTGRSQLHRKVEMTDKESARQALEDLDAELNGLSDDADESVDLATECWEWAILFFLVPLFALIHMLGKLIVLIGKWSLKLK